eukprot:1174460-Prorocentrum_minimum.AAC.2
MRAAERTGGGALARAGHGTGEAGAGGREREAPRRGGPHAAHGCPAAASRAARGPHPRPPPRRCRHT